MAQQRIEMRNKKLNLLIPSGEALSRASRFTARMGGDMPHEFSALAAFPNWALNLSDNDYRVQLSRMAALLYFRPQIDREISGAKLQSLAEEFGEEMIDAALSTQEHAPRAVSNAPLPRPDKMTEIGNAMIERILPQSSQREQVADADTRTLLSTAAIILSTLPPPTIEGKP